MDPLLKFLNSIAYKFPKGYPDMNNEQDILMVENELKSVGVEVNLKEAKKPFEFLSLQAQKVAEEIINLFSYSKENIKADSKNRIIILTDDSRNTIFSKLEDLGFERDPNIKGSSQGGVKNSEGIEIIIKPLSGQGTKSAGKQNESDFNNLINSTIEENKGPITINFISGNGKNLIYKNITKAQDASVAGATSFDKSDTDLLSEGGKIIVGISLKKKNAVRWESSKTRPIEGINIFKSFIEKVGKLGSEDEVGKFDNVVLQPSEKQNKYKLYDPVNDKVLSKVIVKGIPEEVLDKVVFGESKNDVIVIKETFEGGFKNYTFENGVLTIKCSLIYTDIKDIEETDDEPVFAFSNHIGQAYGIEFRSFSKGALYSGDSLRGSSTEIDFNDLK
jgi:hypothetical protein